MQEEVWPGEALRPKIFEAWQRRIDSAGGVYAWNRRNANGRVFQVWATLLSGVSEAAPAERQRMGQRLRDYVLNPPLLPLGRPGTTLPVPGSGEGDYDMAIIGCVSLLGLFERDTLLLPNDVFVHLLKTVAGLFGQASQDEFEVGVLRFPETENHLFMTEGCRLLSNEMLMRNTRGLPGLRVLRDSLEEAGTVIDNARGPLRNLLLKMMAQILRQGFFETNARVYQRFTVHALLNLHAFSQDADLREGAAITLDYLGALFALQSCEGVRWGPYRRSSEAYADSSLYARDAVASFFAVHSGVYPWDDDPDTGLWRWQIGHAGMALWAVVLPYRPPAAIVRLLRGDKGWYEARVSSGGMRASRHGRPTETYAGGPRFVLAAGGPYESYGGTNFPTVGRAFDDAPWVYDMLNRPAALLLAPTTTRPRVLNDLLHLRGSMWRAPKAEVKVEKDADAEKFEVSMSGLGNWGQGSPGARSSGPWHVPEGWANTQNGQDIHPGQRWALNELGLSISITWPDKPKISKPFGDTLPAEGQVTVSDLSGESRPSRVVDTLPFAFPFWRGWEIDSLKPTLAHCQGPPQRQPHVHAFVLGDTVQSFICVDGRGHFYAYHAPSQAYAVANFSLWWRPLRRVFQ
jgi:hypothetical protein